MPKKYLELESAYRNRNLFPNQGSFDVQISQSGLHSQCNAVDPITDAYPIKTFTIKDESITGQIKEMSGAYVGLNVSSPNKFIFTLTSSASNNIFNKNYYAGAVVYEAMGAVRGLPKYIVCRILEWIYLTQTADGHEFSILTDDSIDGKYLVDGPIPNIFKIGQMSYIGATGPQQIFIPSSESASNIYNGYYVFNQSTSSRIKYTAITDFDCDTHLARAETNVQDDAPNLWNKDDVLILRKSLPNIYNGNYHLVNTPSPGPPYTPSNSTYNICTLGIPPTGTTYVMSDPSYINSFVRYYTPATQNPTDSKVTRILGPVVLVSGGSIPTPFYTVDTTGNLYTQYVNNPTNSGNVTPIMLTSTQWIATVDPIPAQYFFEIMPYTCDNFSPFVYNGSMASQNQSVAYEVSLNSLILPNVVLSSGGRISYYPYVYVEIENIGSSSSNINTIYSNNPNTYKAIFKVPITDLNHPTTAPYVKLSGNGMEQTIPFKINSDMRVSVKLSDGSLFKTQLEDNTNGQRPNPLLQLSVTFEVSRL